MAGQAEPPHGRRDAIERDYEIADVAAARFAAAATLAQGDMVHLFAPSRQKLCAGDLSAIALHLRFAG